MLEVRGISKHFGGLKAVDNIDLQVRAGQVIGLIGPNGAGKTTLFNCIAGAMSPTSGEVLLAGKAITGLRASRVCRAGLARTYQIVKPFGGLSVLDNVVVGAIAQTHHIAEATAIADEVLEFTGLSDRRNVPAASLPLPARKRLEISRALATRPSILLLDEVMAGLNPSEVEKAIELIFAIRDRGISILIIEHLMRVIMAVSDEISVMHHGSKLAHGTPAQIVNDQRVIEAYLGEDFGAQG
ncbi:MAG: ABC transporter ATP-binding protein [Burkholderiaceae bacterium]|jgi:branched-chain amino acid transport system ATP-binding protein|nr:ABC transporter ATP-binding protein [Burkholderiaceae bacterium]